MQRFFIFFSLIAIFFVLGCGGDADTSPNTDPSNLKVSITNPDDGSGSISVLATGDNVVDFELDPGDGNDIFSNTTGSFSYTYSATGSYTVTVRAYGESGRFLQDESLVSITLEDDDITQYEGYSLIWQDEFNNTSLNETFWNFEIGDGCDRGLCGWGNNELEYYREENTKVTGGNLVITAKEENFGGRSYTSSRITTQGKFDFKYGRVDIRAKLPEGQGLWPALWMLGSNITTVGWPASGEIDIMEMIGGDGRENTVHGTLHWQNSNGSYANFGMAYSQPTSFSDEFHIFSIIWNESLIEWRVDNNSYQFQSITDPNKVDEFVDNSFFFIFNVAVGGTWPGSPDESTTFPQEMRVDYVRVYQEK